MLLREYASGYWAAALPAALAAKRCFALLRSHPRSSRYRMLQLMRCFLQSVVNGPANARVGNPLGNYSLAV